MRNKSGMTNDVAKRFCDRFGCAADDFEMNFFWSAVPRSCRPLAYVIHAVAPGFFRLDFRYLRRIAQAESKHEFAVMVNALRYEPHFSSGFLRGFLRIRVSGRRLARIAAHIFDDAAQRTSGETPRISIFFKENSPIEKAA